MMICGVIYYALEPEVRKERFFFITSNFFQQDGSDDLAESDYAVVATIECDRRATSVQVGLKIPGLVRRFVL